VISPDDLARQLEEAGAQARVDAHVTTEELPPDVRVVLEDAGTDRVGVMRAIRAFIDMDMAATKALIARAPVMLVESMDGERGRAFRDALVSAGARVTMTDLE
jgi:ribosomal protein L7/L12